MSVRLVSSRAVSTSTGISGCVQPGQAKVVLGPTPLISNENPIHIHSCISLRGLKKSQFPHLCVCERFKYSQDRSAYFLQQNKQNDRSEYINRSQTHECGICDCGRAIPFLRIFVSNFRYWFFAVCTGRNHIAHKSLAREVVFESVNSIVPCRMRC